MACLPVACRPSSQHERSGPETTLAPEIQELSVGRFQDCPPYLSLAGGRSRGVSCISTMIIDPRFQQLADGLAGFSTELKPGERVLIDAFDVPDAMVIALIRAARARGAHPYVQIHRARVTRELSLGAEVEQYSTHAEVELARMQKMDAYIAMRGCATQFGTITS